MLNRSTKVMEQGSAGKESKVHSGTLCTQCERRGEWEYVQWGNFGLFTLYQAKIIPSMELATMTKHFQAGTTQSLLIGLA